MEPNSNILIQSLMPRNLLSFGPEFPGIDLSSLNVLVGANGSGKSNLIEAINLLRAAPKELDAVTRAGGDETRNWTQAPTTKRDLSILAQVQDELRFPELHWLNQSYGRIRIYREWSFGRNAVFRSPQKADMRNDVLEEDFSNLGLILNRLKIRFPAAKKAILNGLKDLYDGINDFDVLIEGGPGLPEREAEFRSAKRSHRTRQGSQASDHGDVQG